MWEGGDGKGNRGGIIKVGEKERKERGGSGQSTPHGPDPA